jgi:sporulation protein YlmC with PRC-barrel domain
MLTKYVTAGLVGSALLATVAFAQTPTTTTDRGAVLSESQLKGSAWRTSKVVGLSVYNNNNESIGSINDLLMDKSGNIKAVVLGVGGFLGMGEHLVAVAFDKVKFVDQPLPSTTTSSANRPATTTGAANNTTTTTSSTSSRNDWYPDHAVYNATKDELKALPEFKY